MALIVERLPAERGGVPPTAAPAGGCCCCCCCCLHSVGSLLGAATTKPPQPPTDDLPAAVVGTPKAEPRYKVTRAYWLTVLLLTTVALPVICYTQGLRLDAVEEWGLLAIMIMPAIQIAASIVVWIGELRSTRPGRRERLRHLGDISIRTFSGAAIGVLVMIALAAVLAK
jgi:hypothetical protein